MLDGLLHVARGGQVLPFVRESFTPADEEGDALMQEEFQEGEHLLAFHGDIHTTTVIPVLASMAGKTQVWESDLVHAMFWSVSHGRQILTHTCGKDQVCLKRGKG